MKKIFIPYKYEIRLKDNFESDNDGYYHIMFNDVERIISNKFFSFSSDEKLTLTEVKDKLRGTIGMVSIVGEFKDLVETVNIKL